MKKLILHNVFERNKILNLFQRLATINLRNTIPQGNIRATVNLWRGLTARGVSEAGNKSAANQIMFDNYPQTQAVSPGIIISTEIQSLSHHIVMGSWNIHESRTEADYNAILTSGLAQNIFVYKINISVLARKVKFNPEFQLIKSTILWGFTADCRHAAFCS